MICHDLVCKKHQVIRVIRLGVCHESTLTRWSNKGRIWACQQFIMGMMGCPYDTVIAQLRKVHVAI